MCGHDTASRNDSGILTSTRLDQMLRVIELGNVPQESLEQVGTKEKFWVTIPEFGRCICKLPRPGTGEDWSEVIAAELATSLGVPHAKYVLAQYQGQRAVVTPSFVPEDGTLILGNQLLVTFDSNYDVGAARFHQSAHTVDAVLRLLEQLRTVGLPEGWTPPAAITLPAEVFLAYLALDALIGNTDRHHQNWGLVAGKTQTYLPWDSWAKPYTDREPAVWHHEVFRTDGTPYREEEVGLIRTLIGRKAKR